MPCASRADGGAASVFTKRCSRGSYTMEESWLRETTRVPPLPPRIVRDVRTGAAVAARPLVTASRGGDFTPSHFVPPAAVKTAALALLLDSTHKNPPPTFFTHLPSLSTES